MSQAEFDHFADTYEKDLAESLAITGESRAFYAQKRIEWTLHCTQALGLAAKRILDYGCGDGANVPMLASAFGAQFVEGVDTSSASITVARRSHSNPSFSFLTLEEWSPRGTFDLAFTNGVFHHIPVAERQTCLSAIHRALRPEGVFAFWENNPWNPGTQYVMSQCAFDRNAVKINPREARHALLEAGFQVLRTDSLFYFPSHLSFLRPMERWLRALPFGGQYLVLCRKS